MLKVSTLGQNIEDMVDCSEVIPAPPAAPIISAQIPYGFNSENITQACPKRSVMESIIQAGTPQE